MWLLLALDAFARAPKSDRLVNVGVGAGAGLVAGAGEDAWGAGFGQRVAVGITPGGGFGALGLELTHSRHAIIDADALFPNASVPADAITGGRDLVTLDLGYRVGINIYGQERPEIQAIPFLRPAIGGALAATDLMVPSFAGQSRMISRALSPMVTLQAGCEVRFGHHFSLLPNIAGHVFLARNAGEQGEKETFDLEWHVLPALDASLSF